MSYEELKEKAKSLGLEFKGNISMNDLEELVRVAEETAAISNKDAVVEAAKPAVAKKSAEPVEAKPMSRQDAMQMIKVKITPLDEALKGLPSDVYTLANGVIGTITQVVLFNKPTVVFKIIVDMLRSTQMPVGVPNENGTVEWTMVEAFSIQEIPLTEEEIAKFKN